jgi:DNA (cytosine-5)-methyltransferase 1
MNQSAISRDEFGAAYRGQMKVEKKYKVVSLFSGAMGLDLGVERTGRFHLLATVEVEKTYCDTVRHNVSKGLLHPGLKVYEGDIRKLDPQRMMNELGLKPGQLDLLVGGPPCQAFSTAGKRGTVQDPRGELLWEFLRFVDAFRPKLFMMENVRGLLSAALKHRPIKARPDKGGNRLDPDEEPGSVVRLFADDLMKLSGAKYHMDCFEVNSVNYGAPQIRERVLFIGNRYNDVVDFPVPTHGVDRKEFDLFVNGPELKPWRTLRDAIGDLAETSPVVMDFSPRKLEILSQVPPGSNWRSLPEDVQKNSMGQAFYAKGGRSGWWRRLSWELPSPTLVTMPNHASTALCHPTQTRALSVREYARIQEFPDNWEIVGKASEQYAQIGNAVPTRLGEVAGNLLALRLDTLQRRRWRAFPGEPKEYRVVYVQSHIRTRQWYKNGEVFIWKEGERNEHAAYSAPRVTSKQRLITAGN